MTMIPSYPLLEKFLNFLCILSFKSPINSMCQETESQKLYESWSKSGCSSVVEKSKNLGGLIPEPVFLKIFFKLIYKLDEIRCNKLVVLLLA